MTKTDILESKKPGFSLIEMVVAIFAISLLVLVIERFFVANLKSYNISKLKLELTDQSIKAYNHITPEVRAATQILACDKNSLTFYYLKGSLSNSPQKIVYSLDTNSRSIIRSSYDPVGTPPNVTYPTKVDETISTNVSNNETNFLFSYFDKNSAALSDPCTPSLVRMIQVDVRNQGTGNYATKEIESKTRIELRVLKDNL